MCQIPKIQCEKDRKGKVRWLWIPFVLFMFLFIIVLGILLTLKR